MWVPSKDVFPHRLAVQYITNERRSAQGDVVSIKSTPFETVLEDLYSGLRNPVYEAGIISSEYFFECAPLDLKPLVQILDGVEIRIILFLRRQDRIIESGYNQEVKAMGATATVAPPRYREYWDWLKLYEKWAEVFGNSNVKIINYDVAAKTGNVLPEYLQALNLPAELLSASDTNISDSSNQSLPANLLEFKRLSNAVPYPGLEKWLFDAVAAGMPAPAFRLSPEIARQHLAFYEESNRELSRRLYGGEVGILFPDSDLAMTPQGQDFSQKLPLETVVQLLVLHIKQTEEKNAALAACIQALEQRIASLVAEKPVAKPF